MPLVENAVKIVGAEEIERIKGGATVAIAPIAGSQNPMKEELTHIDPVVRMPPDKLDDNMRRLEGAMQGQDLPASS